MSKNTQLDYAMIFEFSFCAARRIQGDKHGKANLHGHNFKIRVRMHANMQKAIDIGTCKLNDKCTPYRAAEKLEKWLKSNWDHTFIYHTHDNVATAMINTFAEYEMGMSCYGISSAPSTEKLAEYFLTVVAPNVLDGEYMEVTAVRMWEQPTVSSLIAKPGTALEHV